MGELLFKVSGISGKAEIEDENEEVVESAAADSSKRALADALGVERRDRILAALYLARQDAVNVVRQSSVRIWKALVSNTPRTGEHSDMKALLVARSPVGNSTRNIAGTHWPNYRSHVERRIRAARGTQTQSVVCFIRSTRSQVASRTMGDLCRKSGEKVLTEVVTILKTRASSPDSRTREGVCIALGDLV